MYDKKSKKYFNDNHVAKMRAKLSNYDADENIEERKKTCTCKYCTYIATDLVVMNAFTHSNCRSCNKDLVAANSDTDDFCLDCAKKLNICKHCGSEMD